MIQFLSLTVILAPVIQNEKKKELLHTATTKHQNLYRMAMIGEGTNALWCCVCMWIITLSCPVLLGKPSFIEFINIYHYYYYVYLQ